VVSFLRIAEKCGRGGQKGNQNYQKKYSSHERRVLGSKMSTRAMLNIFNRISLIRRLPFITSQLVSIEQTPSKREVMSTLVRFTFILACIFICTFGYTPNIARQRFHGRLFVALLHPGHRPVAVPIGATKGSSVDNSEAIVSPFDISRQSPTAQDDEKVSILSFQLS
jgi:hypothetical protein